MTSDLPYLGIVAGGGNAPRCVMEACQTQGRRFFVFCLEGQADAGLAEGLPHLWLPLGAFGKLKNTIAAEKIAEIVMIGHVRRPSLMELKPDMLALKLLGKIGFNSLGDDGLLTSVGKVIEEECHVKMIGAHEIIGGVLLREGNLGNHAPDEQAEKDIKRGIAVARLLGQADVGQSVIVQAGIVLGVEAAEGTDMLIARCEALHREGPGGVLVKLVKPQQDERFDLPTIGPDTVIAAAAAGLRGIAAGAERCLVIDRDKMRALADEKGVFVVGVR